MEGVIKMLNNIIIKISEECLVVSGYLLIIEIMNWVIHELQLGQVLKKHKINLVPIHQIKITPYSIFLITIMFMTSSIVLSCYYHFGMLS